MTKESLKIVDKVSDLIGNTPIMRVQLHNQSTLYLKLEQFNPTGSAKIRMAKNMIEKALTSMDQDHGGFVESTSGNTGMGLALMASEKKLKFKAIVDHHASVDKINCMKAYGAEVIYVGEEGKLATDLRDALAADLSEKLNAYWTEQHNNPNNSGAYKGLADELYCALDGNIDVLFGTIGTGGSLCGTGKQLKKALPEIAIYAVEPKGSIIFGKTGHNYFQSGTGTPKGAEVGELIDYELIDGDFQVSDAAAFETCRYFAKNFGLLVGGSAGGAIYEAVKYANSSTSEQNIVVIICDGGEKYLTTVFNDEWMRKNNLLNPSIHAELDALIKIN